MSGLTQRAAWPIRLGNSWDNSTDALQSSPAAVEESARPLHFATRPKEQPWSFRHGRSRTSRTHSALLASARTEVSLWWPTPPIATMPVDLSAKHSTDSAVLTCWSTTLVERLGTMIHSSPTTKRLNQQSFSVSPQPGGPRARCCRACEIKGSGGSSASGPEHRRQPGLHSPTQRQSTRSLDSQKNSRRPEPLSVSMRICSARVGREPHSLTSSASQLLAAPLLRLRKNVRLPTAFSIASSMPQNSQEWPLCSRAMTVAASPVRSSASTAATRSDHTPERHVSTLVQHLERAFEKSHRTGSNIDKIGSCLVVQRPLVNAFEQHRHAEVVEHLVIRKV